MMTVPAHAQPAGIRTLLDQAHALMREEKPVEAGVLYQKILNEDPLNTTARAGWTNVLIRQNKLEEAENYLDEAQSTHPKDIDLLFAEGELREAREEYTEAIAVYERILELHPKNEGARNLKYRALMRQGSHQLVTEQLFTSGEKIDPQLFEQLLGNRAAQRIRWDEPVLAIRQLERNRRHGGSPDFQARRDGDMTLALRLRNHMSTLLRTADERVEAPFWVRNAVADAVLYREEPEEARERYRDLLEKGWDPASGNVTMALYYTLVELGQYAEAEKVLNEIDARTPVQIVDRGELTDNRRKQEIALNQAWLLLYQDRLSDAQPYVEGLLGRSPFDTDARNLMAHLELWRGWPRRAQEEFQILRNIDPESVGGEVGYLYSLNQNDKGDEARRSAEKLRSKHPNNKNVERLKRFFNVQDKRAAQADVSFTREDSDFEEFRYALRYEHPIKPWRMLFAEFLSRDNTSPGLKRSDRRISVGTDWRLNRDWTFIGSVSGDVDEGDAGVSAGLRFDATDYLSFGANYNSFSLNTPFRARSFDITADEWNLNARFRESESFILDAFVSVLDMSDGNDHRSYALRADRALTTQAYWKTRVAVEGNWTTNSTSDVAYFSPEDLYSVYVTPMVEHVWYKRYQKLWLDRFYLGGGPQWQDELSSEFIWHSRYEQEIHFSDVCSLRVGVTYSSRNYDSENVGAWTFDASLRFKF